MLDLNIHCSPSLCHFSVLCVLNLVFKLGNDCCWFYATTHWTIIAKILYYWIKRCVLLLSGICTAPTLITFRSEDVSVLLNVLKKLSLYNLVIIVRTPLGDLCPADCLIAHPWKKSCRRLCALCNKTIQCKTRNEMWTHVNFEKLIDNSTCVDIICSSYYCGSAVW